MKTKPKVVKVKRKLTAKEKAKLLKVADDTRDKINKRKALPKKQVKKNREEAASLAEEKERLLREKRERENTFVNIPYDSEAVLDITVDTGKPIQWMQDATKDSISEPTEYRSGARRIAAIPEGMVVTVEIARKLIAECDRRGRALTRGEARDIFYEHGQNGPRHEETDAALQADFESSKKRLGSEFEIRDNVVENYSCAIGYEPEDNHGGTIIVAMIVLFCAFAGGIATGYFAHEPRVEYKNQILYRNAAQTYDLKDNPWAAQKIPLLPEDIQIIERAR